MTIQDYAKHMLEELEAGWLEVCKVPSREGGYIRVPVSVIAEWYSRFCRRYMGRRRKYPKPRTIIKRRDTIKALKHLEEGKNNTVYTKRLVDFIENFYRYN